MEVKIDKTEYDLPSYLSIENYVKIYKVKDLFTDQYFAAKLISIVGDIPLDLLLKQDYEEINFLAVYIMSLLPLDEKPKFYDRFELDGKQYGFFPNWKDLTFAEFVDMDTISTKPHSELLDLLHVLAAIMYRPIEHEITEHNFLIEEYDVNTMKERAELFKKKLDIKYVLGAQFFFIKFARRFSLYSQVSSTPTISTWMKIKLLWRLRKIMWKTAFKKPTDGSLSSIESLQTILQSTITSTKKT